MAKICLDAGHYGKYNQSPANMIYYESDIMWKLHLLLKKYLESSGIQVITTRSSQGTDLTLYDRGAKSKGCDLFLSLHSNAVGSGINESIDYPVAYAAINGKADQIATLLTECVENVLGTIQKARIEHRTGSSGNDYYGVVRGATAVGTPGLILEHSFHTNTRITNWLLSDSNLERLAKAEAEVIAAYYGTAVPEGPNAAFNRMNSGTCTGNGVRVRTGPGIGYDIVYKLDKGNRFDVDGQVTNGWHHIHIKNETINVIGWMYGDYVDLDEVPTTKDRYYRVRTSWNDAASQIGAYTFLENAKSACPQGYKVYDWNGDEVYANV